MAKKILIVEVINSKSADDDEKGKIVLEKIKQFVEMKETQIILDFAGIELVNTAFLNDAIGRLFNKEEFDLLKNTVKIANIDNSVLELLRETISLARIRYGNMETL